MDFAVAHTRQMAQISTERFLYIFSSRGIKYGQDKSLASPFTYFTLHGRFGIQGFNLQLSTMPVYYDITG